MPNPSLNDVEVAHSDVGIYAILNKKKIEKEIVKNRENLSSKGLFL